MCPVGRFLPWQAAQKVSPCVFKRKSILRHYLPRFDPGDMQAIQQRRVGGAEESVTFKDLSAQE